MSANTELRVNPTSASYDVCSTTNTSCEVPSNSHLEEIEMHDRKQREAAAHLKRRNTARPHLSNSSFNSCDAPKVQKHNFFRNLINTISMLF